MLNSRRAPVTLENCKDYAAIIEECEELESLDDEVEAILSDISIHLTALSNL